MRVRSRSEIVGLRRQRGFLGGMGPAASGGISALPEIGHSLRFNSVDSPYATMVPSGTTDGTKFTISFWMKRSALTLPTYGKYILSSYSVAGWPSGISFPGGTDSLEFYLCSGASTVGYISTNQLFRDPAAWYHVLCVYESSHGTAAERLRMYINGVRVTSFASSSYPALNATTTLGESGVTQFLGRYYNSNYHYDGYLARFCFVDGQALSPSDFAYTDYNGQWRSKAAAVCKAVVDAGGTSSCMLDFNDGSSTVTLGNDYSSKNNDWTLTNFTATGGVVGDWVEDTPTNNFPIINWLNNNGGVVRDGGLTVVTSVSAASLSFGTFNIPTTGKWYWEFVYTAGAYCFSGVGKPLSTSTYCVYYTNGQKYVNGTGSAYGAAYTLNDIIGVAVDSDAGTITFYKNGASQGAISIDFSGGDYAAWFSDGSSSDSVTQHANFGQRAFNYTPPTGFKALCTKNLPTPSIVKPNQHFDVNLRTGTGASFNVTGKCQSDFVWTKERSAADNHRLFSRGLTNVYTLLESNTTSAEIDNSNMLTSFNSDGFSGGSGAGLTGFNDSGATYVDWMWKANGAGVSNTDGSISSTVSANQTAGFSIVTYTGTGANATVGHGLSVAPKMVIVKGRNGAARSWPVGHPALTSWAYGIWMQSNGAQSSWPTGFNSTAPTSSVLSIGTSGSTNASGETYVAYCFAEIPGYSKFSSYIGNGSSNGPCVWCGFPPKYIMVKRVDVAADWQIYDAVRKSFRNPLGEPLFPNSSAMETYSSLAIDILASGFKIRDNATSINASGGTYLFTAFAEAPFKFANAR